MFLHHLLHVWYHVIWVFIDETLHIHISMYLHKPQRSHCDRLAYIYGPPRSTKFITSFFLLIWYFQEIQWHYSDLGNNNFDIFGDARFHLKNINFSPVGKERNIGSENEHLAREKTLFIYTVHQKVKHYQFSHYRILGIGYQYFDLCWHGMHIGMTYGHLKGLVIWLFQYWINVLLLDANNIILIYIYFKIHPGDA